MTRTDFLTAYALALRAPQLEAELLIHVPELYPNGPLIRVKVKVPQGVILPPMLAPASTVWYAQTGQFKGLLEDQQAAVELGLTPLDAANLCLASDKPLEALTFDQRRWRVGLLDALEGLAKTARLRQR